MTKQERISEVKKLLNDLLFLCAKNQDEFLLEVSETIENLIQKEEQESLDNNRNPDDYLLP